MGESMHRVFLDLFPMSFHSSQQILPPLLLHLIYSLGGWMVLEKIQLSMALAH